MIERKYHNSKPRISSVSAALPEFFVEQTRVREWAGSYFAGAFSDVDRLLRVFDNSGIEKRHFCVPPEWFFSNKSFEEKNAAYIEQACNLGSQAAAGCLEKAGLDPADVDYLIFVSTTGLATPSIDARLIGMLGMAQHTRRTPIWGLGCAGGVAGLSHACHHTIGHPRERVLLVAVELCGITFNFEDLGKSNLVATALFADGAAAALVSGAETGDAGPEIMGSGSTLWPDSLDVMGWNILNEGMQVVFSRAIPGIVRKKSKPDIEEFLKRFDLGIEDLDHLICHPGGVKVLEAYEEALGMPPEMTANAREVLRDYGNISSVTVLLVLERFLRDGATRQGDLGLMTALGPGFSSEHVLVRF